MKGSVCPGPSPRLLNQLRPSRCVCPFQLLGGGAQAGSPGAPGRSLEEPTVPEILVSVPPCAARGACPAPRVSRVPPTPSVTRLCSAFSPHLARR